MKKVLLISLMVTLLSACNSGGSPTSNNYSVSGTANSNNNQSSNTYTYTMTVSKYSNSSPSSCSGSFREKLTTDFTSAPQTFTLT